MPRNLSIATLWTAAWRESNVKRTCPGEHMLPDRPEVHYVITRKVRDAAAAAAYLVERGIQLQPGETVGEVPPRMSADGYLVSRLVTDPAELAAFAELMAPDEQLGTVEAADRPAILLTEAELGDLIDANYRGRGDVLFHREGLPWYDVASQNADREAWRAGRFDPTQVSAWADQLAAEREQGMVSQRLRIVSAVLTDDERMSLQAALPLISRQEEVRVLRRGEQPVPDLVDHDYWVVRPADGPVVVIAMRYDVGGAFLGAQVVPPSGHAPYLRDQQLAWALAVPYGQWWAAHPDLHGRSAA